MSTPSELREAIVKASTTFIPENVPQHVDWLAGKELILEPGQVDAILDAFIASLPKAHTPDDSPMAMWSQSETYCYNLAIERMTELLQSAKSRSSK